MANEILVKPWGLFVLWWIRTNYDNDVKSNGAGAALIKDIQMRLAGRTEMPQSTEQSIKAQVSSILEFSNLWFANAFKTKAIASNHFKLPVTKSEYSCNSGTYTEEKIAAIETDECNCVESLATEKSHGEVGLMIANKMKRHIFHFQSRSNCLLLGTSDCNSEITIICNQSPAEQTSRGYKKL